MSERARGWLLVWRVEGKAEEGEGRGERRRRKSTDEGRVAQRSRDGKGDGGKKGREGKTRKRKKRRGRRQIETQQGKKREKVRVVRLG